MKILILEELTQLSAIFSFYVIIFSSCNILNLMVETKLSHFFIIKCFGDENESSFLFLVFRIMPWRKYENIFHVKLNVRKNGKTPVYLWQSCLQVLMKVWKAKTISYIAVYCSRKTGWNVFFLPTKYFILFIYIVKV